MGEDGANVLDGERGEGWVVAQGALVGALLLAPRVGPAWPRGLARLARVLALPALAAGGTLALRAVDDLGPSFAVLPKPKPDARLVRGGVYERVRHPIYAGVVLLAFGWAALTANTTRAILAAGLLALLSAKADREEAWLTERFPEYTAYQMRVPKLVPKGWRQGRA